VLHLYSPFSTYPYIISAHYKIQLYFIQVTAPETYCRVANKIKRVGRHTEKNNTDLTRLATIIKGK